MSDEPDFDPADFKPGTMGCHEALHMAHVAASFVDEYVADHPAVQANDEWRFLADAAVSNLGKLYQAIGAAHLVDKGDAA